jgi:hypothetical protein
MMQSGSLRGATILGRTRLFALAVVALIAFSAPNAFAQGPTKVKANKSTSFNVVPILITSVTIEGGQLMANGLAGATPFSVPITLTPGETPEGASCPILNLSLGPIHVDLLGLVVDTSRICLDITAVPRQGALLGNLLCAIAGLLDPDGLNLPDVLAGLDADARTALDRGLTQLLNQAVFIPLTSSEALQAATCEVLSLSLGPLDLNLLGLRVELDNCANGPVTVDITAEPEGGLLGSLLCGLANLLNGGNPNTLVALLGQIAALIGALSAVVIPVV